MIDYTAYVTYVTCLLTYNIENNIRVAISSKYSIIKTNICYNSNDFHMCY